MPTATTTPRVAQQSRHSPPTTPGTTVAQAMDKKPLMHKAQTRHVEHNDAPAARRATSMTCSGELVPASIIYVHPPTPESKTPVVAQIVPPAGSSPLARLVESRRRRVGGSPRSSSSASPVASPKLEDGPLPAGGQDVRPPRRKKSPSTSPTDSPRPSRTSSPRQSTPPALPLTEAVLKSALRAIPMFGSASSNLISPSSSGTNTPTATTPVAEMVPRPAAVVAAVTAAAAASSKASSAAPSISPPQISSSADVSRSASPSLAQQAAARRPLPRPSISPATTSFNSRRAAQGRPTLHSTATTLALKLNLENLDRPRFNASTQAFVTEPSDAPPAMRTTPLVRKKSGELVPSILRREHGPSYDGNPLSSTSTCSTGSASPYPLSSKSLPATPSCPKFVHFDTRLERVRLFLAEQKPAAVSRGGSPTDPAAPPGGGEEFPFPSTSDEEEALRRSLEIRLPNFPIQQPFDASVYLDSLALVEGGASLKGVVHVRNLSFGKRVCVRFTSDWWSTTSEVTAVYQDSIKGATFDRFIFHIKLQDLLARIEEKTLFLAIRYNADGHPEIWDSNGGQNYQVQFHKTKGMKASELRDTRRSVGRKAAEWSDKVHSGPLADRMADLKAQLSRLAADDPDGEISSPSYRSLSDGSSTAGSPGGSLASISTHKALYSPGLDPTASPLAARYDFGASLKGVASGNNKAGSPGFYRPNMKTTSVGTGWNGSPLGEERLELLAETNLRPPAPPSPLPSSSVAFSPTGEVSTDGIGLRFDPSSFGTPGLKWPPPPGGARFDPGPPSSFPSSIYGTLPTSPSSYDSSAATTGPVSFSAFAVPAPAAEQTITTTAMTPITESTALSTPTARKHTRSHSRSSDSSGAVDYFSAPSVRRTPPASPYITLGEPTTTAAPGRPRASAAALASRTFPAPTADELPSALVRHASYASSSSASSSPTSTSGTDSPLSMASTPNTTASNGGTPVGIPLLSPPIYALGGDGYDPSLSMPRSGSNWIGSSSYSDFVNQFCFFTGSGSDPTVASTTASSALGLSPSSSPPYRSPGGGSAAASVDSFFTPREGSSTSGFTTPTASVSPPSGGYPSHATAKHHSMSDYFSGGYTVSPVHSTTELEAAESSARRQQTPPALESSA